MNLLDSPWFLQMADAQGKVPAERLVAVFRILGQWLAAPGVRELLARHHAEQRQPLHEQAPLTRYLRDTAAATRVADPSVLASQLVILLQGALAEELRNPQGQAMQSAAQAAAAIVDSACRARRDWPRFKLFGGALAASLLAGVLTLHGWSQTHAPAARPPAAAQARTPGLSPETMSAVLQLHDRFEQGICPSPQLLTMTQNQVAAYQRIVSLNLADGAEADANNLRAFLQWYASTRSSECYLAPANGHTTVAWVTRPGTAR